ncbi:hypothetical protein B597_015155 [Stutzerimonas stutzeri KOS6]|uniref:Uncharacterized protein n=1 Tax=Stutzerimonas stutzeri KOS6 TaxID=1218352 RepID=A0A061JQM9_STUST|nr:hypothetical protein B597_015155 [Stutzerimonas stutzeri KOS6]
MIDSIFLEQQQGKRERRRAERQRNDKARCVSEEQHLEKGGDAEQSGP